MRDVPTFLSALKTMWLSWMSGANDSRVFMTAIICITTLALVYMVWSKG